MKISFLKSAKDEKSFRLFELLGAETYKIEDLEKTDKVIKELIKKNYKTMVVTNDVAGFSELIAKKNYMVDDIRIIIAPPK